MVSRSICISAILTVFLVHVGYTKGWVCPPALGEINLWVSRLVGSCMTELVSNLRQSRDRCSEKVNSVDDCLHEKSSPCIEAVSEDDPIGMRVYLTRTVEIFIGSAPKYEPVFCGGNVTDWDALAPAMVLPGCGDDLSREAKTCSELFMEIIKADPFDERLCSEYDAVTSCQTQKVKQYCPRMTAEQLQGDEDSRKAMNFFCPREDEPPDSGIKGSDDRDGQDNGKEGADANEVGDTNRGSAQPFISSGYIFFIIFLSTFIADF
ncbi:uncharacterized protein [Ptychodera flava]|uniref:uncharacterized protein n=1 Tax=Ptychodera flava TaxID=63121 RepID=UPI00396AAFF1